jgi:hypothetical protein
MSILFAFRGVAPRSTAPAYRRRRDPCENIPQAPSGAGTVSPNPDNSPNLSKKSRIDIKAHPCYGHIVLPAMPVPWGAGAFQYLDQPLKKIQTLF